MKSNILTIFRKECARFFGDKALFFTSVIMPGLIIYLTYTFIGSGIESQTAPMDPSMMEEDMAMGRTIWGHILPMLIITLLFSGIMAAVPSAIAGEKERGTIATLLITPMRRSELAWGKLLSLSLFALLSGISGFLGVMLSLPKMMGGEGIGIGSFSAGDYLALLLVILSTVLLLVGIVSVVAAFAKDVKNAGSMLVPLMFVVMLVSLLPLIGQSSSEWWASLIPLYNSVLAMTDIISGDIAPLHLLLTLLSNVAWASLTVWGLTMQFNSERIMFGK